MPKITNTRLQRAMQLRERLGRGPSFGADHFVPCGLTREQSAKVVEEFGRSYRRWSETWVIPEAVSLIKELQD